MLGECCKGGMSMPVFLASESLIFALFLMGVIFSGIELFVPGFGVFGAIGIICTAISVVLTFLYMPYGIYIVTGEIIILAIIVYFAVKYVKRKQLYGRLILNESLGKDTNDVSDLKNLIGQQGVSKTALKPFGFAEINGNSVEVRSDVNYIQENTKIIVSEIVNNKVVVKEVN